MSETKIEKPLVYLDQNILDLFVKGHFEDLSKILLTQYQVVYSNETLKEIQRSGDYANKFINILKTLNAFHIGIAFHAYSFKPNGDATISCDDPETIYYSFISNRNPEEDHVISESTKMGLKFYGGIPNIDFNSMLESQQNAFNELVKKNIEELSLYESELPGITEIFTQNYKKLSEDAEESISLIRNRMTVDIGDGLNWSGVKDVREFTGVGPLELNNIDPPNIVKKIWFRLQEKEIFPADLNIEDFLSFNSSYSQPERPLFAYEKVLSLYNLLNIFGYYPDAKQHLDRRFISAQSDGMHGSISCFCHAIISRDERFVKKLTAVFEYLDINTEVVFLNWNLTDD